MLKLNSELRREARAALQGNWGMSAVVVLVYLAVTSICSCIPMVGWLLSILICFPMSWGLYIVFYKLYNERVLTFDTLFDGYKDYGRILGTVLLVQIYTFLWSLLLIVPGIIKACSYAMTPFILRDHPELSFNAAIEKSMAMMEGNKMKYFLLCLSFIGWGILCVLTLGIGTLFLSPYMNTSFAAFYNDLKAQQPEVTVQAA